MASVLIRGELWTQICTQEEQHANMKAEIGVMLFSQGL